MEIEIIMGQRRADILEISNSSAAGWEEIPEKIKLGWEEIVKYKIRKDSHDWNYAEFR